MATAAIHVVPDDSFDDWIVRGDIGDRQIVPAMIGRNRPVPYYTLTPSTCE
jgi:hypothetical protein